MRGSKFFTTLDLYGAFHQIPLERESKQYTAFSTSWEKYHFNSVPFGLVSSPYAWLKTIHSVLRGLIGHNVFVYMDDIIIFARTIETHLDILKKVLENLMKHKLKLKIDKSKFLKDRVIYLGFIISTEGLMTDPKKIESIKKFPRPHNVKEVQSFLGMCNYYRRYIKDYASLGKPLYNLCKKDTEFKWDSKCETSFNEFKQILSNPPILIYPNFAEQFILHTDASNDAIGAVLSQGMIPHDKPIHFFSKVLNPAQTRYSTIEKELLAIILAVENFNYYLTGREFLIVTDHRPLMFLFNAKNINSRLHRWKYTLMGYQFKIIYRRGSENVVADALSRIRLPEPETDDNENFKVINIQTRNQRKQEIEQKEKLTESQNIEIQIDSETNTNENNQAINENMKTNETIEENNNINKEISTNDVKRKDNYIRENKNMLIKSDEFDHIFFLFDKENCEMQKKLQYRTKIRIVLHELNKNNEVYSLDTNRSIIMYHPFIRTQFDRDKIKNVIDNMIKICVNNTYENIAINVNFPEYRSYFEFKFLLRDFLKPLPIKATIFLNKIIDVTDLDEIEEILQMYHNSLFGGHTN